MRGRKLSSLFCLPQPQSRIAPHCCTKSTEQISRNYPFIARPCHSLRCILYDIALRLRLSLFDLHNTVFPLICDSPGSWSNLFSDWCDCNSNSASNSRQEQRTSIEYCASTKRIRRTIYSEKSAGVVPLASRVSPLKAAASSFLPHPLRQDLRNSAIFAQRLALFE